MFQPTLRAGQTLTGSFRCWLKEITDRRISTNFEHIERVRFGFQPTPRDPLYRSLSFLTNTESVFLTVRLTLALGMQPRDPAEPRSVCVCVLFPRTCKQKTVRRIVGVCVCVWCSCVHARPLLDTGLLYLSLKCVCVFGARAVRVVCPNKGFGSLLKCNRELVPPPVLWFVVVLSEPAGPSPVYSVHELALPSSRFLYPSLYTVIAQL